MNKQGQIDMLSHIRDILTDEYDQSPHYTSEFIEYLKIDGAIGKLIATLLTEETRKIVKIKKGVHIMNKQEQIDMVRHIKDMVDDFYDASPTHSTSESLTYLEIDNDLSHLLRCLMVEQIHTMGKE